MDERYYIFGGLALLLLALVAYLLASVARYRRAVRNARQAAPTPETDGEPKYITADDRASAAFSSVPAEVADETPVDVVVEEPAEVAEGAAAPAYTPAPAADPIARLYDSLSQAPDGETAPQQPFPAESAAPLVDFHPEEPLALEEPLVPEEPLAPEEPAPEMFPELTPAPPEAPPAPVYTPSPQPGYTVADELERLMSAAETQSAFLPTEAHEQVVTPPAEPEPEPSYEPPPLLPPLSVGEALSSPAAAATSDYELVAPVELQFTGGGGRVGVKPGTRSYAEFQRLAGIMLSDLQAARGR